MPMERSLVIILLLVSCCCVCFDGALSAAFFVSLSVIDLYARSSALVRATFLFVAKASRTGVSKLPKATMCRFYCFVVSLSYHTKLARYRIIVERDRGGKISSSGNFDY